MGSTRTSILEILRNANSSVSVLRSSRAAHHRKTSQIGTPAHARVAYAGLGCADPSIRGPLGNGRQNNTRPCLARRPVAVLRKLRLGLGSLLAQQRGTCTEMGQL